MKILIAGDSLASDYSAACFPMMGWGQALRHFILPETVLKNYAQPGRSTKRFSEEGHWNRLLEDTSSGDHVLISFGHNDQKPEGVSPEQFRKNLIEYCSGIRAKGAMPYLITAIIRISKWDEKTDSWEDTQKEYPQILRDVAAELQVPMFDLQNYSRECAKKLGRKEMERLYAFPSPRNNWVPEGALDTSHPGIFGAYFWAKYLVQESFERNLAVKECFQHL